MAVVFPLRLTGPLDPGVFGLDPGSRASVVVGRVAAEGAARGGPAEAATVRVGAVASALLGGRVVDRRQREAGSAGL